MKHAFATLVIAFGLSVSAVPTALAAEVEKEPLNLQEITELVVEQQADEAQIENVEAGMKAGAGLILIGIVALAIAVAA